MTDTARRRDIADRLQALTRRVDQACRAADRESSEVTVVVVTKTYPASDVRLLAELGVTDVGENRPQEATAKHEACQDLPLRWHLVGGLQTNKVAMVVPWVDVIHSVDRLRLVTALERGLADGDRVIDALVQVSLDGDPDRGGIAVSQVPALVDEVAGSPHLRLRGVMAVAPLGAPAEGAFSLLERIAGQVRARHPGADWMSAGMSGDLEAAIAAGATHVRVGSAVLGPRPPLG